MSRRTRCAVRVSLIVALLALPVEVLMIGALMNGATDVSQSWAARLSASEIEDAIRNVGELPIEYRKNLVQTLNAAQQAALWQGVTDRYLERTSQLSAEQRRAVLKGRLLATEEFFLDPTPERKAEVQRVAEEVRRQLGDEVFRELFTEAGPPVTTTRALPIRVRVESYMQGKFVAHAFTNCNCHAGEDAQNCSGDTPLCSQLVGCNFWYIGCGIWYQSTCDGYCSAPGGGDLL